jgi:hypothetical protein
MKQKITTSIAFLLVLLFQTSIVHATDIPSLPGGKNYLNPNQFVYDGSYLVTSSDILIEGDHYYTITVPRDVNVDYILIESSSTLLDIDYGNLDECTDYVDRTSCTFYADVADTSLSIIIGGRDLDIYYSENGFFGFQIEQGTSSTEYEGYYPIQDTTQPTISGSGVYITDYHDLSTADEIMTSSLSAIDEKDGDVSNTLQVVEDTYTENIGVVGNYYIIVEAHDQNNNQARFKLDIVIKDEVDPMINGNNEVFTSVDAPLLIETIISNYHGFDEYDGNTVVFVKTDNYTSSNTQIGSYNVVLETRDSSGNSATKSITIHVEDNQAPTISNTLDYTTVLSNPKTLEEIMNLIEVSDNYENDSNITKTVMVDNYTSNKNKMGDYIVTIVLSDPSFNQESYDITIHVLDDIKPQIIIDNHMILSYDEILTEENLLELITLYDNESVLTKSDIEITTNTYIGNESIIGDYIITLQVEDESFNKTVKTITVTVIDLVAPVISYQNSSVNVKQNVNFTVDDYIKHMIKNNEIEDYPVSVIILEDTYTENKNIPGTYKMIVKMLDKEGLETIREMDINVLKSEENNEKFMVENLLTIVLYSSSVVILGVVIYKTTKK